MNLPRLVRSTEDLLIALGKMLEEEPAELYQTKKEMLHATMKASQGKCNPKTVMEYIDKIWDERY